MQFFAHRGHPRCSDPRCAQSFPPTETVLWRSTSLALPDQPRFNSSPRAMCPQEWQRCILIRNRSPHRPWSGIIGSTGEMDIPRFRGTRALTGLASIRMRHHFNSLVPKRAEAVKNPI
jgi:hypothetical protein